MRGGYLLYSIYLNIEQLSSNFLVATETGVQLGSETFVLKNAIDKNIVFVFSMTYYTPGLFTAQLRARNRGLLKNV